MGSCSTIFIYPSVKMIQRVGIHWNWYGSIVMDQLLESGWDNAMRKSQRFQEPLVSFRSHCNWSRQFDHFKMSILSKENPCDP